jgi:hypothetical protein
MMQNPTLKVSRRTMLMAGAAVLATGLGASTRAQTSADAGPFRAMGLRTEGRAAPLGIDETAPVASWRVGGDALQQAYQIRVGASVAELRSGHASLLDTRRVESTDNLYIPLASLDLKSRQAAAWQVRLWDQAGRPSAWSEPAAFEMGLLTPADWTARWIENPDYDYSRPQGGETPLPIFEAAFPIDGQVARARLYITGLGMYASTLNGQAFTDNVLEPGQTTYADEVHYRTYDLTAQLKRGDNRLRIETGSGAYQRVVTPGRYHFGGQLEVFRTYGEPKVIAQLEITYADGRQQVVATDESWRTALGATTFSSWWSGEEYDARRSADPEWRQVALARLSDETTPRAQTPLRADPRPPVTVAETLRPVSITPRGNGSYVLDFGANHSGMPSLRLSAPAGTTVTLTPSESLARDGGLAVGSMGINDTNGKIAYRYTSAGVGVETWTPMFTYHGFRYLQVDGLPTAPTSDTVTLKVVRASNPATSAFDSSRPLLQAIRAMTLRSIQSNMMSVLTDCPDREKGPYTGDNLHNIDALLTDYDMSAYQPQLVRNMATAQRKPGDVTPGLISNITPEFHRVQPMMLRRPEGMIQFLDEVNWGGAIIRIPWRLYETYGDTRTLARFYPNMVAWLDYVADVKRKNKGDIPGLGDWIATDISTPMMLPIIAGYHTAAADMAKIAALLGQTPDQARYAALADDLAQEFNSRFRHTDARGVFYGSDSETSNAMALEAGLVAPSDQAQVVERLVAAVRRAGNHITTGSVGIGPLFRALQAAGLNDVIYDMVVNPTSPGYGYLIARGNTTLAEALNGDASQNHHFLGQVDAWLVQGLAGIRPAPGSIGYTPGGGPPRSDQGSHLRMGRFHLAARRDPQRLAQDAGRAAFRRDPPRWNGGGDLHTRGASRRDPCLRRQGPAPVAAHGERSHLPHGARKQPLPGRGLMGAVNRRLMGSIGTAAWTLV